MSERLEIGQRVRYMMTKKEWFAASVIMFFRYRNGRQKKFPVWENVYLIFARDSKEAARRAEKRGRQASIVGEDMTWAGRPVDLIYGGVRKIITCSADPSSDQVVVTKIHDGVEATFSTFTVNSKADLDALIQGNSVAVVYGED